MENENPGLLGGNIDAVIECHFESQTYLRKLTKSNEEKNGKKNRFQLLWRKKNTSVPDSSDSNPNPSVNTPPLTTQTVTQSLNTCKCVKNNKKRKKPFFWRNKKTPIENSLELRQKSNVDSSQVIEAHVLKKCDKHEKKHRFVFFRKNKKISSEESSNMEQTPTAITSGTSIPASVDVVKNLQNVVNDMQDIMHQNLEAVIDRGDKLDELVIRSEKLCQDAQVFQKTVRRRRCCCCLVPRCCIKFRCFSKKSCGPDDVV